MYTFVENESGFENSRDKLNCVGVDLEGNDDMERCFEQVKSFTEDVLSPIDSITGLVQQNAQTISVTVLLRDLIIPVTG